MIRQPSPGTTRSSARRASVRSEDFDASVNHRKRIFRFHDMTHFRREGHHLCADDFLLISASSADSLIPPEHMESLLRCVKGFLPTTAGVRPKPVVADSQTTVWHLGVKLLQLYMGSTAFSALPVYKKQMEAVNYDESRSSVVVASLKEVSGCDVYHISSSDYCHCLSMIHSLLSLFTMYG